MRAGSTDRGILVDAEQDLKVIAAIVNYMYVWELLTGEQNEDRGI
jgi:hypothetical protein